MRTFRYGARKPQEGEQLVWDQFRLAHRYRNKLCELEHTRRNQFYEALASMSPELLDVEQEIGFPSRGAGDGRGMAPATGIHIEIEAAEAAVRARRAQRKSRRPDCEGKAALAALRKRRTALRKRRTALRKDLYGREGWQELNSSLQGEHRAAVRLARAESGLYWGTYLQVEDAAKTMSKGAPPRFRPWRARKDKLAVQLQGGLSVERLLSGEDRRVRLQLRGRPHAQPGSRRGKALLDGVLSMRVGSDGRDPIWCEVPVRFHRPLPERATIKWVYLMRRSVGAKDVWSVHFVCAADSWEKPDLATTGSVGIDVGWRRFPDRLRVAVWAGNDGDEGELALPSWWIDESRKVRGIRAERDRLLDGVRQQVSAWADPEDRQWIAQTRSCQRIERLVRGALARGEGVPLEVREWRKRERHLHEYEAHLREQLGSSRLDLYRCFAAMITRRYATVGLEDLDLRTFHVLPPVESGESVRDDIPKFYVRDACLSKLVGSLRERAREIVLVEHAGTTETCYSCGEVDAEWGEGERAHELIHECPSCGLVWDRDVNAARNILSRGSSGDPVQWSRPPLAPEDVMSYPKGTGNRAQRKAMQAAALETKRTEPEGMAV